jgi:hypothetical protein
MRKSTIAATVCIGGILAAWGAIATMGAVAHIIGGSYGSHDVSDFAIENFLFLGLLFALDGLIAWSASRGLTTSDERVTNSRRTRMSAIVLTRTGTQTDERC